MSSCTDFEAWYGRQLSILREARHTIPAIAVTEKQLAETAVKSGVGANYHALRWFMRIKMRPEHKKELKVGLKNVHEARFNYLRRVQETFNADYLTATDLARVAAPGLGLTFRGALNYIVELPAKKRESLGIYEKHKILTAA